MRDAATPDAYHAPPYLVTRQPQPAIMPSANVTSIAAIREFRAALVQFADEAASALDSMSTQIHRALDWVEHEQPPYWQQQIKAAFDEVAHTRVRLDACLLRTVAGQRPSCIEEKQDHRKARQRLEYCRQMVPKVKAWGVKFRHEADEYRGRMGNLTRMIEVELPRMIALIEGTVAALEKYADIAAEPLEQTANAASDPDT
jgi:hypothetical protein